MAPARGSDRRAYSPFLYGTLETAKVYMQGAGITYSQTNLNGAGTTDSFSGPPLSKLSFAYEAEAQHDHGVYLAHVTPSSKKA